MNIQEQIQACEKTLKGLEAEMGFNPLAYSLEEHRLFFDYGCYFGKLTALRELETETISPRLTIKTIIIKKPEVKVSDELKEFIVNYIAEYDTDDVIDGYMVEDLIEQKERVCDKLRPELDLLIKDLEGLDEFFLINDER